MIDVHQNAGLNRRKNPLRARVSGNRCNERNPLIVSGQKCSVFVILMYLCPSRKHDRYWSCNNCQTRPNLCLTLPTYHFPRWTFSSAINTRSPIAKLRRDFIHFALSCSVDTYSNSQPFQKMLDVYSTCTTCCSGGCCIYGYLRSQKIQRTNLDLLSITINDLV